MLLYCFFDLLTTVAKSSHVSKCKSSSVMLYIILSLVVSLITSPIEVVVVII